MGLGLYLLHSSGEELFVTYLVNVEGVTGD